jgi:hypothetical protein
VAGVPLKLTALVLKKFAPNKSIVFPGAAELGPRSLSEIDCRLMAGGRTFS